MNTAALHPEQYSRQLAAMNAAIHRRHLPQARSSDALAVALGWPSHAERVESLAQGLHDAPLRMSDPRWEDQFREALGDVDQLVDIPRLLAEVLGCEASEETIEATLTFLRAALEQTSAMALLGPAAARDPARSLSITTQQTSSSGRIELQYHVFQELSDTPLEITEVDAMLSNPDGVVIGSMMVSIYNVRDLIELEHALRLCERAGDRHIYHLGNALRDAGLIFPSIKLRPLCFGVIHRWVLAPGARRRRIGLPFLKECLAEIQHYIPAFTFVAADAGFAGGASLFPPEQRALAANITRYTIEEYLMANMPSGEIMPDVPLVFYETLVHGSPAAMAARLRQHSVLSPG